MNNKLVIDKVTDYVFSMNLADYRKTLLELAICRQHASHLDQYFLSMLIASELDVQNDLDNDNDSNYDRIFHKQLQYQWISKYEDIYALKRYNSESYYPPYYDDNRDPKKMPFDWSMFLMEKAPSLENIKIISHNNNLENIINHAKLKILILDHYKDLSDDFNTKVDPLNIIVYQNIDQQISDWKICLDELNKLVTSI